MRSRFEMNEITFDLNMFTYKINYSMNEFVTWAL